MASEERNTLDRYARIGGFMYLFVIGVFIAGDLLAGSFHVPGAFAQTAANIRQGEALYRTGLSLQLIASVTTILLGGAFYVLLRVVDRHLALFALLWRVLEAAIGGVAVIFKFAALNLYLGGAEAIGLEHQDALARTISGSTRASFPISVIYFSAGSILFFHLLYKSRFIPRWLSLLGVGASILAGMMGFATLIVPQQAAAMQWLWAPIFVAEILTGLQLMVRGAKFDWWNARGQAAQAPAP